MLDGDEVFDEIREMIDEIKEIFLDIAEDSPDTAERIRSEFYERLQNLGRSPGIGHYHEEFVIHGARDLAVFLNLRLPN